jgi:hypothetical protein
MTRGAGGVQGLDELGAGGEPLGEAVAGADPSQGISDPWVVECAGADEFGPGRAAFERDTIGAAAQQIPTGCVAEGGFAVGAQRAQHHHGALG